MNLKDLQYLTFILITTLLFGCGISCSHLEGADSNNGFKNHNRWNKYLASTFKVHNFKKENLSKKNIWLVKPGINWQWQLSGKIETDINADVFDIDLFDAPIELIVNLKNNNKKIICYFSAGSYEHWRPDASYFPKKIKGKKLSGWNELWLDIRKIDTLKPIMIRRMDLAVKKGCDAIEPDNIDGYTNKTGFKISARAQIRYNKMLSKLAHDRGLAIALKNDGGQAKILEPWFDFAISEQCFQYKNCKDYLPFIEADKAVLGVEYNLDPEDFCTKANSLNFDFLHKKINLGSYRHYCKPQ